MRVQVWGGGWGYGIFFEIGGRHKGGNCRNWGYYAFYQL